MKKTFHTSVVIIGAGPAGAGCSIFLSKMGIPHVVVEKETFPRDKICGDACSGKTAYVLRSANPDWFHEILRDNENHTPSHGIIFVAPNGKQLNVPFRHDRKPEDLPPGFTATRMYFDNFLFGKMNTPHATTLQNSSVKNMERLPDGKMQVLLTSNGEEYEINASILVGADGDKSMVRKQFLASHTNAKAYAVGLRAYYEGVTDLHEENFLELHFLPEMLPGYFWIFPMPGGRVNVGVGILSDVIREKKINLRESMLKAIENNKTISKRFANAKLIGKIQGWGLPMSTEKLPVSGDNFMLVGDAATLIDPFSGEGIGNALFSGMLAAKAAEQALTQARFDGAFLKQEYDDVLFNKIGDELKISATLQRLCKYPWLFNFVVNKANKSVSLQKTISGMFANLDLRDQLRKPSFYWNILVNK